MTKMARALVAIATTLLLIFGSVSMIVNATKIFDTAVSLEMIRMEIEDYNEDPIKTIEDDQRYRELVEEREGIYNSPDPVVRWYCDQAYVVKATLGMASVLSVPCVALVWFKQLFVLAEKLIRKLKKGAGRKVRKVNR